jgi:hypothetical protein
MTLTRGRPVRSAGGHGATRPGSRWRRLLPLRVVTAVALLVDAVVHLQLASRYDANSAGALSQGDLFRMEAVAAVVAAALLVATTGWAAWLLAVAVAGSALGAVLLYGYADIGPVGPIPDMYERVWYGQKVVAAAAEAVGTLTAGLGLLITLRRASSLTPAG